MGVRSRKLCQSGALGDGSTSDVQDGLEREVPGAFSCNLGMRDWAPESVA